jgi:hypothetical protein
MGKVKTISAFGEDFEKLALELSRAVGDCALTVSEEVYDDLRAWTELKGEEVGEKVHPHSVLFFQGLKARVWLYKRENG